jgi:hypothetical protein
MKLKLAYVCGLAFLVGCADSRPLPPTVPSPTPTAVTPAPIPGPNPCPLPCPAPGVHALSGVVRVAGVPVIGAQVGLIKLGISAPVSPGPEELIASVVTDANGAYSFSRVENVSFSGALVSVVKAGYFTDTKYIQMSEDRQLDFDLERAVQISLGDVIQGQLGEARCASTGYGGMGGAVCRRFALPLPASGTLDVTVSSSPESAFDMTVLRGNGTIGIYAGSSVSPLKVTLTGAAGSTYQIDVVCISPKIREFELTTSLR